ncbi:MAG: phosphotransferase [Kiritimatiellae bacterium]|nr:phosphotransferase [Kiritimatiellia bacterium]
MARKAIVLAAGFGTRLRPFTCVVPKPLLPVWGVAMLERVVAWLREQGVEEIAVNCHYLHEQVEAWCKDNGCRAVYEPEILGTGGVLNPLRDWIGEDDFWLVNGDIVFELGDKALPKFDWKGAKGAEIIGCALVSEEGPRTIEVEPDASLVTCWRSPDPGWGGTFTYCGIALLKAGILSYIKEEGFSSIVDAYEKAMMDGKFVRAVKPEGMLWTDAGTVDSYIELNRDGETNAFGDIPQIKATGLEDVEFCGARGSDRAFFKTAKEYIVIYDDEKRAENARYASHAKWLKEQGVKVPSILADLPGMKTLVMENAGSEDLLARSKRRGEDRLYDYVAVVEELVKFNSLDCPLELEAPFDDSLYAWERELFAKHYLGERMHMEMPEAVRRELEGVAKRLLAEPMALVHRDFQSSNIIWKNEEFKIIDFQGMRKGPAAYDLASLIYDPYVDLREGERRALAALYAKKANRPELAETVKFAAVERLVQALGAFGRLASVGKSGFTKHILPALQNLLAAADDAALDATGAMAEELIAREMKASGHEHHHCGCSHDHGEGDHAHCQCGHDHNHGHGGCE